MKRRTSLCFFAAVLLVAGWWVRRPERPSAEEPTDVVAAPPSQTHRATVTARALEPKSPPAAIQSPALGLGGGAVGNQVAISTWLLFNAQNAERAVDMFCEDTRRVKTANLFPPGTDGGDASALMDGQMGGGGSELGSQRKELTLLRHRRRTVGAQWPELLASPETAGIDLSWMHQLLPFESWVPSVPISDYSQFVPRAMLRLSRGLAAGDYLAADQEVRHLAGLIQAQGELANADVIPTQLLAVDLRAREFALSKGLDVSQWPAISKEDAQQSRRAGYSTPFFFAPGVPAAVMEKAFACLAEPCAALVSGLELQARFASFLEGDRKGWVEKRAVASHCPEEVLDHVRGLAEADPSRWDELPLDAGWAVISGIPRDYWDAGWPYDS